MEKINPLDPNNGQTAYGEARPPNIQLSKQNTSLLLGVEVSLKDTKTSGEIMIPSSNKRETTSNEIKPLQEQVDKFIETKNFPPRHGKEKEHSENQHQRFKKSYNTQRETGS